MINVLYYTECLSAGGVTSMMTQWIIHKDINVHIDIYVRKIASEEAAENLRKLGCHIYEANCGVYDLISKSKKLNGILTAEHYDAIHIHTSSATDFWAVLTAKKKGVKTRIAHSHNVRHFSKFTTKVAHYICRPILRAYTTKFCACSSLSMKALFGHSDKVMHEGVIVKNGINTDAYKFNRDDRDTVRRELGFEDDTFVVGSIGLLNGQKNYMFLLELMREIKEQDVYAVCVLIGDGDNRNELEAYAVRNELNVKFLGYRKDAARLMNALDLFVLVSLYEGFPVVAVEAQANGLPCIFSEAVPPEAVFSTNSRRISLDDKRKWVEGIRRSVNEYRFCEALRIGGRQNVINKGYDIDTSKTAVNELYAEKGGTQNDMQSGE